MPESTLERSETIDACFDTMPIGTTWQSRLLAAIPFGITFLTTLCVSIGVQWQTDYKVAKDSTVGGMTQKIDKPESEATFTVSSNLVRPSSRRSWIAASGLGKNVMQTEKSAEDHILLPSDVSTFVPHNMVMVTEDAAEHLTNKDSTPIYRVAYARATEKPAFLASKSGFKDPPTDVVIAKQSSEKTLSCKTGICPTGVKNIRLAKIPLRNESSTSMNETCSVARKLDTALEWAGSLDEAGMLARKQNKLVYLIHVSGNFEIPEFT